jgi:4-hydroxy 2-oxovalerate aldolase
VTGPAELSIRVTDSTLRDGSHAVGHSFTVEQVVAIVGALDQAGIPVIEVSHGDGLGGSSLTYGRSAVDERVLIATAARTARRARIAVLILPGIGVRDDIDAAHDHGASIVRVATHCTEADIAGQHFERARALGMETVGFLMMAHAISAEALAVQARSMVDAGCQCVYVTDSAGALILDDVTERVAAMREAIGEQAQVGYHGHMNLAMGVANSILAVRAGATQIDGCSLALGAGAGNTPTEVLAAVCDRVGIQTGIDVAAALDVAEDIVRPMIDRPPAIDRMAIVMGYAGVYSSFLKHAERAAVRYGVSGTDILRVCGERRLVGGQEDQIIDIAVGLAAGQAAYRPGRPASGSSDTGTPWATTSGREESP